jgi:hypothetical protein
VVDEINLREVLFQDDRFHSDDATQSAPTNSPRK